MIITIGQFVEAKQPNIHRTLTCWAQMGAEAATQYRVAQRMLMGRLKFGALRRLMETPPRPGNAGMLPGEKAVG